MPRTMPPGQRVEVEKMRYGDGLDVRPQLGLALEQDVIIASRVVLNVIVGMWRQRRAIRIHRSGIARTRAVFIVSAGNIPIGDSSPLPGSQIEGMDI